jgi:hypothetical protein
MNWNKAARQLIKFELVRQDVRYALLAYKLGEIGVQETQSTITKKLSRGTFSFIFFLQCMRALGVTHVDLSQIVDDSIDNK